MRKISRRISLSSGWPTLLLLLMLAPASWAQRPSQEFLASNLDLLLISTDTVQNNLKITSGQGELLEALGEDLRSQPGFTRAMRGERRRGRSRSRNIPNSERIIRLLLEEEQQKRLSELRFQFQGPYAIEDGAFAKEINLTSEQLKAIREARTKSRVLRHSQLVDLIGEEKASVWRETLGRRVTFGRELSGYRSAYLEIMQDKAKSEQRD